MRLALTLGGIVISAALLFRSLRRARHPMVVREMFDAARHLLQMVAVVAVVIITGVRAPTPLLAASLIAGMVLGIVTGSSLQLEPRDRRVYATRSVVGAAIWGTGLVFAQLAGLADRTGLFRIGQAVSWFGLAAALATFGARRPRLHEARASLPKMVGVAALLLIVGALAVGISSEPRTASATPTPTPGWWQLTAMQEEGSIPAENGFTSISHLPGLITAAVDIEGFGSSFTATYPRFPVELQPGTEHSIPIEVSGNASGIIQRYTSLTVTQLTATGWTGISVGVEANCIDPIGDAPVSCTPPASVPGVFVYDVPALTPDTTFVVGIGVLNCQCAIWGIYSATAAPAAVPPVVDNGVVPVAPPLGQSPTDGGSSGSSSSDDDEPADDESVSDDEALTTSAAVVAVISLIGLVDLAERRRNPDGTQPPPTLDEPPPDEPPPNRPKTRRPGVPMPSPVDPSVAERADRLAEQAIEFAEAAIGPLVNYDAVYDHIKQLQDRIKSGNGQPGDVEVLQALRDALWAIGRAERDATISAAAREAAVLSALETLAGVEMEVGKAAAGTFGPASATIYAGFVESVANRDKGAAAALGHGAVGGLAAWVGAPSGSSIGQLTTTWSALRAGAGGAAQNAAEDLGHQAVDSGGDVSQIDLSRTATSSVIGAVTGAGGHIVRPGVHVEGADWNAPTTHTRATPLDPPPRAPGVEPPRVAPADQPSWPSRTPNNPVPDSVEIPLPVESWPRDASGRILDPGGNHLMTQTPDGFQAPDGTPISRVITNRGRPIGYETPDGRQVISVAEPPDPSVRPTVQEGGVPPDPDSPATTQL